MVAPSRANLPMAKSRYTAIIISVVVFLLLTSSVLVTSIYNSLKIRDLRAGTLLSSNLRSDLPTLTKEIYLLNNMRVRNEDAAEIQALTNKVSEITKTVDTEIDILEKGGNVVIRGDEVPYVPVSQSDQQEFVNETVSLWKNYQGNANFFLADPKPLTNAELEQQFGGLSNQIYDSASELANSLNAENGSRAEFLRNLQIFGISFAILYFIIFVSYFVRRLKKSDEELMVARRETQEIMETVNTGLFLLDKDLNIGQQHSKALGKIMGTERLAGQNFASVLRGRISDKDLNTTRQFIEQLYNPRVKERLVDSLNPLHKVMLHDASDDQNATNRFLDFKFSRVYEDKDIARILVNVNDVSDAVYLEQRLEKERAQNDMQIEMLTTILNVNPVMINEFINNTRVRIDQMNNILKNPGSSQYELESKLNAIYREMHSLKGEASALKLHSFTKIASDAEDKLAELQNQGKLAGNDFLALAVHLDELLTLSNTISKLGARINQNSAPQNITSQNTAHEVVGAEAEIVAAAPRTPIAVQPLTYYQDFAEQIAARQNKQVELQSKTINQINVPERLNNVVKEITIQLLRNAIVHGIETPNERIAAGKPEAGQIDVEVKKEDSHVIVTLQDDGRGIDYDKIRSRLVQLGRFTTEAAQKLERSELLGQLFSSGFSTKDDTDEDGGRGVGLDIIKAHVQELGGKLNINSEFGKMTRFIITLPNS
ncbi:Hpt domain-containing protein [Psychrobacter ciconiae]|uniref:Hpt domain-containing protein n=1 Tax=Psychrobacter ciconiae TaxID=1553449 RepID=UPI001D1008AE|nr:Hpt domain-containing protein [Psychrobacter ciconiae]